MRWAARTALAGTAGVALIGAGALTAGYAAAGSPPDSPSVSATPSRDPQLEELAAAEHDLQSQLAGLEDAVARLATGAPTPTVPVSRPPAPAPAPPTDQPPAIQQPSDDDEDESHDEGESHDEDESHESESDD